MNKTIDYYMSLPYTIEVIPAIEEGGFYARVKELSGCMTQADSWEELLPMIHEAMSLWLEISLEFNDNIPEPEKSNRPDQFAIESI